MSVASFLLPLQAIPQNKTTMSTIVPLSPLGGGPTAGSLGTFDVEIQLQDQWCWAAVSKSVAYFFGSTQWTQCSIAETQFPGMDCCGNDGPDGCNKPWYLDRALKQVGHFGRWVGSIFPLTTISSEIAADRPLCCRIEWADASGAHFVALGGWSMAAGGTAFVDVHDPYYGFVQTSYHDFCSSYRANGDKWSDTYFVVNAPVVALAGGGGTAPDTSPPMSG